MQERKWQMDVQRVKNKQNDGGVSVEVEVEVKGRGACVVVCLKYVDRDQENVSWH